MTEKLIFRPYQERDLQSVVQLWHQAGLLVPWNNPFLDIQRKVEHSNHDFWLLFGEGTGFAKGHSFDLENLANQNDSSGSNYVEGQTLIATLMLGYEGHRGVVNYLAVHPEWQGSGLGKQLMAFAEQQLIEKGCPKINLFVRATNQAVVNFYEKLGYQEEKAVAFGKRLIPDPSYDLENETP